MTSATTRPIPPLRELRKQRDLNVAQTAHLAGVGKSAISEFERGLRPLPAMAVVKLSKALRVEPTRITG